MTTACHGSLSRGAVDLAAALRALADAGHPYDALRVAVEAVLKSARPLAAPTRRRASGA